MVPTCAMPALLTRMSIRPNSLATASTAASTSAGAETSQHRATASSSAARIAAAARSAASESMSNTATRAPCRANSVAIAAPMPDPAPVTTATLSPRSNIAGARNITYFTGKVKDPTPRGLRSKRQDLSELVLYRVKLRRRQLTHLPGDHVVLNRPDDAGDDRRVRKAGFAPRPD